MKISPYNPSGPEPPLCGSRISLASLGVFADTSSRKGNVLCFFPDGRTKKAKEYLLYGLLAGHAHPIARVPTWVEI